MGKRWVWGLLAGMLGHLPSWGASPVGFEQKRLRGVKVSVVTIDLRSPGVKVTVGLARGFPATDEPFPLLMQRLRPVAAITGTFFSVQSLLPVGDIVRDGYVEYRAGFGTALAITPGNRARFLRLRPGEERDWSPYETVLACGPTLLREGKVFLSPRHEGFRSPRVLGKAPRAAVGITPRRKLKWVVTAQPVSLEELAWLLKDLGCTEGMNLDGGTSAALWYRGSIVLAPGRPLVNVLACYEGVPEVYRFAPGMPQAQARAKQRASKAAEWFRRAEGALAKGLARQGAQWLELAARLDGENAGYFLRWAEVLKEVGIRQEVGAAYARAAEIYARKGMLAEAVRCYEQALAYHPRHVMARRNLAQLLRQMGHLPQAEAQQAILLRMAQDWSVPRWLAGEKGLVPPTVSRALPPQVTVEEGVLQVPSWGLGLPLDEEWRYDWERATNRLRLSHRSQPAWVYVQPLPLPADASPEEILQALWPQEFLPNLQGERFTWRSVPVHRWRYLTILDGEWFRTDLWVMLRRRLPLVFSFLTPSAAEAQTEPLFLALRSRWLWQVESEGPSPAQPFGKPQQ